MGADSNPSLPSVRTTSCMDPRKLLHPPRSFLFRSRDRRIKQSLLLIVICCVHLYAPYHQEPSYFRSSPSSSVSLHRFLSLASVVTPASAAEQFYPSHGGHASAPVLSRGLNNHQGSLLFGDREEDNTTQTADTLDGSSPSDDYERLNQLQQRRSRLFRFRRDLQSRRKMEEERRRRSEEDEAKKVGVVRVKINIRNKRQPGAPPVVAGPSRLPGQKTGRANVRAAVPLNRVFDGRLRITRGQWWNAVFRCALSALQLVTIRLPIIMYSIGLGVVISTFGVASPFVILYSAIAGSFVLAYLVSSVVSFIVSASVLLFAKVEPSPSEAHTSRSGSNFGFSENGTFEELVEKDEI